MDRRRGRLIVQTPGGTAGKNAKSYKLALPTAWVKAMGMGETDREMELCFDGKTITITRPKMMQEFVAEGRADGHNLLRLYYYRGDTLCTQIVADRTAEKLYVENYRAEPLFTAFGNNQNPTWADFLDFLEDRCIPRTRAGLRTYLETIGLECYDPLEIIRKTGGRMAEDNQWLRVEVVE